MLDNKKRFQYILNAGPNPSIAAGLFGAALKRLLLAREGVSILWAYDPFGVFPAGLANQDTIQMKEVHLFARFPKF